MSDHDSVLVDLRNMLEIDGKDKNYFSHMILGVEILENGMPLGAVVKMKCSPILALGVIDLLHQKLDEARETVMQELQEYEKSAMTTESSEDDEDTGFKRFENMMRNAAKHMSDEDRAFFADSQRRALAALLSNDEEALKDIIAEMRERLEKKRKDKSDDGFDLNDFKGNF